MEQGTLALEEGTKAADVPSGAGASLRVAMVPRSEAEDTCGSLALRSWVKAWLCYTGILDAFLSVAIYLSMMPQYVSLPYVAAEKAPVPAILAQSVAYPLLMTIVAGKAQILLSLVAEVAQHEDKNHIIEMWTHLLMVVFNLSEECRQKVERTLKICFCTTFFIGIAIGVVMEVRGSNLGIISGILAVCLTGTTIFAYCYYAAMIAQIIRSQYLYQEIPEEEQDEGVMKYEITRPLPRRDMWMGTEYMVAAIVGQVSLGLLVIFEIINAKLLILSTAMGTMFYAFAFSHFFPPMVRKPCAVCPCTSCFWIVISLVVALSVLFSLTLAIRIPEKHMEQPTFQPGQPFNDAYVGPGQLAGHGAYPVCNGMSWVTRNLEGKDLLALDMLAFATAIYWTKQEDIMAELGNATYNTELYPVELEELDDVQAVARIGVFKLPRINTRVIAVRGTAQAADWIFNADVWAPSVLTGLVRKVMPLGSLFPMSFSRIAMAPDIRSLLGLDPPWESLRAKIAAVKKKSDEDGFGLALTGHSLGGGMAQLCGSIEGIRSLTFSPVGQAVASGRVNGDHIKHQLPIENTAVSVVPYGDIVPLIDDQLGVAQSIACTSINPVRCHSLTQTACELYRKCGDPRNRSIDLTCKQQVGKDWRDIPWKRFSWHD